MGGPTSLSTGEESPRTIAGQEEEASSGPRTGSTGPALASPGGEWSHPRAGRNMRRMSHRSTSSSPGCSHIPLWGCQALPGSRTRCSASAKSLRLQLLRSSCLQSAGMLRAGSQSWTGQHRRRGSNENKGDSPHPPASGPLLPSSTLTCFLPPGIASPRAMRRLGAAPAWGDACSPAGSSQRNFATRQPFRCCQRIQYASSPRPAGLPAGMVFLLPTSAPQTCNSRAPWLLR
eukprot:763419-Hanusia_phi.AAC.4